MKCPRCQEENCPRAKFCQRDPADPPVRQGWHGGAAAPMLPLLAAAASCDALRSKRGARVAGRLRAVRMVRLLMARPTIMQTVSRVVCLVLVAWASLAMAAEQATPGRPIRLGYLATNQPSPEVLDAFRQRLREAGFIEGRNLVIELRHASGQRHRLDAIAAELAHASPDVLVASGTSAVLAARSVTRTIPIVIAGASDPVAFGLVRSLAHPGGNITGVADSPGREIEGKRLELLKEAVPDATRIAVVLDSSGQRDPRPIRAAAAALGLTLIVSLETTNAEEFRRTLATLKRERAQALYAPETPVNAQHRDLLVALAAEHRLPAIYGAREFVEAGGLMAYGPSYVELHRHVVSYIERITKGARAGELPVEQPTRLELTLNLKTADALGLTIPRPVLLRADHIIR
jgi:putative tryptophan/tyrosine transport system substrate-binding protein